MNPEEKRCPFCDELIRSSAIRCKHCHAELSVPLMTMVDQPLASEVGESPIAPSAVRTTALISELDIAELLAHLVDRSLVTFDEATGRYYLLETVRQYARDRLAESVDADEWRDRHLAHFLALAEEAQPHLLGRDVQTWQNRLEIEHDNLRSALEWGTGETTEPESGLRICGALHYFWLGSGHFWEGRNWCRTALARANQNEKTAARAATLQCAAGMEYAQGEFAAAVPFYEQSLTIWRELEDLRGIAQALNGLGIVACDQGDYDPARSLHEQSLAIRRKLGDPWTISQSLCNLGVVEAAKGDYSSARSLLEESLSIRQRELGIHRGTAIVLHSLGRVAYMEGDYAAAQSILEESLSIRRKVADLSRSAESLMDLGNVSLELGDLVSAHSRFQESLSIWADLRVQEGLARLLDSFAELAVSRAEIVLAARLWGAAESLRQEFRGSLWVGEQKRHDASVAVARARLGDDAAFYAAWQDGRAMTMDQAIELALGDDDG